MPAPSHRDSEGHVDEGQELPALRSRNMIWASAS